MLTAAATPTYRHYLDKARLASARQYVDNFKSQITQYYTNHGIIPTNAQLNIPSSIPTTDEEYLAQPYVAYVTITPETTTSTQCQYGTSTAYFSNYHGGDFFSDGTSKYVVFTNYFIDLNGVMTQMCSYYEYDPATMGPTDNNIFADCINSTTMPQDIRTIIDSSCN